MVANGKLPLDQITKILGVKLSKPTANALKNAIAKSKWRITVALPGGGYRDFAMQKAMRAASVGNSIAEKKRWNLSTSSTKPLAHAGGSSHGWGTRVDLLFNGSDNPTQAQIDFMEEFGFTREYGAADRNHFKHNGKTAIHAPVPKAKPVAISGVIEGVDYSYDRPSAKGLHTAGKKFAVRYITTPEKGAKGIDQAEFDALRAADLSVVVVFERNAKDALKGRDQGIADAKLAQKNLKAIDGLPDSLPVYFAIDWDAVPKEQEKINAYLGGAASILGLARVGVYGSYFVCERVKAAGKAKWFWQTYAWSGGKVLDGIHLHQYKNGVALAGGTVDLTRALKSSYGQKAVSPTTHATATPLPSPPVVTAHVEVEPATGVIYFRVEGEPEIYVYLPLAGKKRHVTATEWKLIKLAGTPAVQNLSEADLSKIPTAS